MAKMKPQEIADALALALIADRLDQNQLDDATRREEAAAKLRVIAGQVVGRRRVKNAELPGLVTDAVDCGWLMDHWNSLKSEKQGGVMVASVDRRKHAASRILEVRKACEVAGKNEREFWIELMKRVASSPAHNGKNPSGWVANFDYLLRPNTWVRFTESAGWFKSQQAAPASGANGARAEVRQQAIADVSKRGFAIPEEA